MYSIFYILCKNTDGVYSTSTSKLELLNLKKKPMQKKKKKESKRDNKNPENKQTKHIAWNRMG